MKRKERKKGGGRITEERKHSGKGEHPASKNSVFALRERSLQV